MTETMIETNDTEKAREMAELRWANNFLCLWRVCGDASCRRARSCRGRAHLCFKRNKDVVPKGARLFFEKLLAAKFVGLPFEEFPRGHGMRGGDQSLFRLAPCRP